MGNVVVTQYFKQHLSATITLSLSCLRETQFASVQCRYTVFSRRVSRCSCKMVEYWISHRGERVRKADAHFRDLCVNLKPPQSQRNHVSRGARVSVSHLRTGTSLPHTPTADKHSGAAIRMFLPELQDLMGICYKQEVMDFCWRRNQYPQFSTPHHIEVCEEYVCVVAKVVRSQFGLHRICFKSLLRSLCRFSSRNRISSPRGQILTWFSTVFGVLCYTSSLNHPASLLFFVCGISPLLTQRHQMRFYRPRGKIRHVRWRDQSEKHS